MIKSVLLHANDDDAMDARFQVALDVCRALGAHLTCLSVTPYNAYIAFDPFALLDDGLCPGKAGIGRAEPY